MRPRKLPYLKLLEGNRGHRPIGPKQNALGIEANGSPFAPEHLSYEATQCLECIRNSMPPAVYATLDTFLLSAFAEAWSIHKIAATEIALPGFEHVITNRAGVQMASPWLGVLNKQAALMASLSGRLGLDPISRASLNPPTERRAPSKFDGLVAGQPRPAPDRDQEA